MSEHETDRHDHEEERDERWGIKLLERFVKAFESFASSVQSIATTLASATAPAVATKFHFVFGGNLNKARTDASGVTPISDTQQQPIAVVGVDAAGALGAALASGAKIAIVTSDSTVATFVADPTPVPQTVLDGSGNVVASNVPSLISGNLVPTQPIKANVPFTATYAITNADGTPGDTSAAQLSVVAGTEVSESIIFGAPTDVTPATPAPAPAASARPSGTVRMKGGR